MIVRSHHMDAFARSGRADFEDRATGNLRRFFPERTSNWSGEDARRFVAESEARAGAYGLLSEQAVMCYCHLRLRLGDDFESRPEHAWVPPLLSDTGYEPDVRAKCTLWLVENDQLARPVEGGR